MIASRFKIAAALGLVLILLLPACASPAPTSTPSNTPTATSTATTTPPAKTTQPTGPYGELTVALSSFGEETFDPTKRSLQGMVDQLAPMYEFILRVGDAGEVSPGVAERWEIAPDGSSWTFYIRKGIKFDNGEDLTAADVKFSMDRYMAEGSFYPNLNNMVESVEMVDDYTVRFKTKGPQPFLTENMLNAYSSCQGVITPKDYIESSGMAQFERRPVGAGPFKFLRYVAGDVIEYEALDKHWRQAAAFKKLSIIKVPEESTRVAMLKAGELDMITIGIEAGGDLVSAGFRSSSLDPVNVWVNLHGAYHPKGASLPIANIKVRQALSLAINRDELIKDFFYGKASPPLPPGLFEVSGDVDVPYWANYAREIYKYDPEAAKKLLADAGYANGFNIKLYTYPISGAPYLPKLGEILQAYWQNIGVKAEIVPVDEAAYKSIRHELKSKTTELVGQAALFRSSSRPAAPASLQTPYGTQGVLGILNTAFPNVEKQINGAFTEMDPAKRKDMLAQAIKEATDTYVCLGLALVPTLVGLGPRLDIDFPKGARGIGFLEFAKHRE